MVIICYKLIWFSIYCIFTIFSTQPNRESDEDHLQILSICIIKKYIYNALFYIIILILLFITTAFTVRI